MQHGERAPDRDPASRRIDRKRIECVRNFRQSGGGEIARILFVSVKSLAAIGGACAVCCGSALAQSAAEPLSRAARPVVVEMFLSQSCSQSPPAADVVTALAARPDVVALTWHVDYWDSVPAHKVGPWADPFARPDFGARQIAYNSRIKGRAAKLTPQAVIDGFISVAGGRRDAVEQRILEAQFYDEKAHATPPVLEIDAARDGIIRTRIENVGAPYDAVMVSFSPKATTQVAAGDNAGLTFREANVVRAVHLIAKDQSGAGAFSFKAPAQDLDCAVLVHERNTGRVVAARYCED